MHNDGDLQQLFAVTTSGRLVARVRVSTTVVDVEDIAIGPGPKNGVDFVYLGDIGDNNENRKEVRIVRFGEPILSSVNEAEIRVGGAEVLRLTYPDGPHNSEALLVDPATGDIYIATKANERTRLYRAAAGNLMANSPAVLELVANLKVEDISGGDISRSGDRVLLRKEDRGWLWTRQAGEELTAALKRAPIGVRVRGRGQGNNGEAVGFSPNGGSYFTVSEGKQPVICVFPVPAPPAIEPVAADP
jgi:hypothetical protein